MRRTEEVDRYTNSLNLNPKISKKKNYRNKQNAKKEEDFKAVTIVSTMKCYGQW